LLCQTHEQNKLIIHRHENTDITYALCFPHNTGKQNAKDLLNAGTLEYNSNKSQRRASWR
jgi:hypothetical protein